MNERVKFRKGGILWAIGLFLALAVFLAWWVRDSHEYDQTVNDDPGVRYGR